MAVRGVRVCGLVVCLLLVFFFSSLLLVFGVVRAQPCEHARYPRTPLRLPCCVLSSLLRSPPFLLLWNGGGGFTMCRSVVLA
nr:MAG TPA: hypothetical protein [Caudoviricetes sp.]